MKHSSQIENRELAYTMALAENPLRFLAKAATEAGLESEANNAIKKANVAGVIAGKAYLLELSGVMDLQEKEILKEEKIVRATFDDFSFHNHKFRPNGGYHKGIATRAWNALANGKPVFDGNGLNEVLVRNDNNEGFSSSKVMAINIDEKVIGILPQLRECGKLAAEFINDYYSSKLAESEYQEDK